MRAIAETEAPRAGRVGSEIHYWNFLILMFVKARQRRNILVLRQFAVSGSAVMQPKLPPS